MIGCVFCQEQDDPNGVKVYNRCDLRPNSEPCPSCAEYIALEAEITAMQDSLQKKLVRRREVREDINRRHNYMLNRMPNEVTTYIFELSASLDDPSDGSTPLLDGERYAPLFLGSVCRAWRDVAWRMPQLWTFINIHIPTLKDMPTRLDIARQWLSRSGSHRPLSIHLRSHETFNPDEVFTERDLVMLESEAQDAFEPLAKLLCAYTSRWKVLYVSCPPSVLNLLCCHSGDAPKVRTLQLSVTSSPHLFCDLDPFLFGPPGRPLPQPNSVILDYISPSAVALDWTRLTCLTLKRVDMDEAIKALSEVPNLGKLTMSNMIMFRVRSASSVITYPRLHALHLDVSRGGSVAFLKRLSLPALKDLSINLNANTGVLNRVTHLIKRSACTLVSISLWRIPNERPALLELIRRLNNVEDLEIRYSGPEFKAGCYFLQALDDLRNDPKLRVLTNLRRLSYTLHPQDDEISHNVIGHVVHPKWLKDFPQWRRLTILRDPNHPFFRDPKNGNFMIKQFYIETRLKLIGLINAGIELFMPFKITREDIAKTLENYVTSTMSDNVILQGLLSAMDNLE